jgi:hypothetical protein
MTEYEKQKDFSLLFNNLTNEKVIQNVETNKNPFIYLSFYLNEYPTTVDIKDFNQCLTIQRNILQDTDYAYNCFLIEMSLLKEGKKIYLNQIVDYLFECSKLSSEQNAFVANAIMQLFTKICHSHFNIYLDSKNRKKLSKWYILKEPIKSFISKKLPEDKWFMNIMTYRFESQFISKKTTFTTFKALFEGKYLENKINWIDNKASLYYFIKLLISEKVIQNPKNKHWEIVSEFFLIKGESIEQSELINQKPTTDKDKINSIKRFVDLLAKY